jgi:hypothetical protein
MITEAKRQWLKEYRQRNKEHIHKVARAKYLRNKEKYNAHSRWYYRQDPVKRRLKAKEYRKAHPEKIRQESRDKYKKYRKQFLIGAKTRNKYKDLLKNGRCEECGSNKQLQFHHPKPYRVNTFKLLCQICHYKEHGKKCYEYKGRGERAVFSVLNEGVKA